MDQQPVIFMAHPLGAATQEEMQANIRNAKAWYHFFITNHYVAIIADWILSCETLDDTVIEDRLRGQRSNAVLLTRADELWLCGGRISKGMRGEMLTMHALDKPIREFVSLGVAPPEQYIEEAHNVNSELRRVVDATWQMRLGSTKKLRDRDNLQST